MWFRLALALLLLAGAVSPESRRSIEALRFLADIADGPAVPPTHTLASPITRKEHIIDKELTADLYATRRPSKAGLVLVPGLSRESKDDPRLVDFAFTLARAGFTVMVPDLTGRRSLRIGPGDIPEMAAAVHDLSKRLGRPVGLAAASYAVGPAFLVALETDAASQVDFVLGIGGYLSLEAAITYVTTGYYRAAPDMPWQFRRPSGIAPWLLVQAQADLLDDPTDRTLMRHMAERRLARPSAPIDDLAERLGPQGTAVYRLFTNTDPDAVPKLMAELPAAIRKLLADIDLARRNLHHLEATPILIHGRDDPAIPYTQSKALAAALSAEPQSLALVDGLAHIEIQNLNLSDVFSLWHASTLLLARRDSLRAMGF